MLRIEPGVSGDYNGYMLFPRSGKYRIWAEEDGREIASVVVLVP